MKYKMIVADCDDTMLNSEGEYSNYFRQTLKRYILKGGKFVIATGRMTAAVLPYCYDLGLKGEVISYQGAITSDIQTGEVYSIIKIENADALEVANYIETNGYYYHIYSEDKFFVKHRTERSEQYGRLCGVESVELGYPISEYIEKSNIRPLKMMILTDEENVMPLISVLEKKFGEKFLFNTSKKWMIEIVPIVTNKGIAVEALAKKYYIKKEEVICIGDSLNDLAMIEYAGLGVVVANGSREAKAAADVIAPSNDDDGVAYIINKYGFLE